MDVRVGDIVQIKDLTKQQQQPSYVNTIMPDYSGKCFEIKTIKENMFPDDGRERLFTLKKNDWIWSEDLFIIIKHKARWMIC